MPRASISISGSNNAAMRAGRILAFLLFFAGDGPRLLGQAQPPSAQTTPTIRVSVDRVNIGVTVTDSSGHFVEGLRREDFHIFDNGVEQPITDFLSIEDSAQLVLLIESGPAVFFLGQDHIRAADTLLTSISPADRVAIVSYSRTPDLLLDFTPDKTEAHLALQQVSFAAGFGDLNLFSSLATTIDWLAAVPGKKTVVLLSTGIDTSPSGSWEFVQQKLKTSDVRVLAVSLAGDFRKPAKAKRLSPQARADRAFVKEGFAQADQCLRAASLSSGGRVYFPKNAQEFQRTYAEVAQLVRHEYSLAFVPSSRDGQIHLIRVKAKHSWYRVDHRQAYLAPAP
jgi:Ca-activated chloride channel family protein